MTLLRSELTKILFQKRTYIGWIALLAIPALVAVALNFGDPGGGAGGGPSSGQDGFFSLAADNGLLVPLAAISMLASFFLPLVASMAGGFQLAGEAESSTLKTWRVHPVNRGPVVLSKGLTAVLYVFAGLALAALVGYATGIPFFGAGRVALLSGGTVSVARGLGLTLLAYLYVGLAMVAVVSISMLISALTDSSLTAAIGTLVIVIVMQIVGQLSYFEFLKPYLFTSHLDDWQVFFQGSIDWTTIWKGILAFVAYAGVSLGVTWQLFKRRDVLV
jgi:ABC-2 type transport system permease protein